MNLTFILLLVALFVSTPKILLFYDTPEYVKIVSNNSFLASLSKGHTPIHPVFIGILWIAIRVLILIPGVNWEYAGSLTAYLFSFISLLFFYKLTRFFIKDTYLRLISTVIFIFFPAIWIVHTNLLVESMTLPFFVVSFYLLCKYLENRKLVYGLLYSVALFLMTGTHVESFIWIPALVGFWFITAGNIKIEVLKKVFIYTFLGIIFSLVFYLLIFLSQGQNLYLSIRDLFFVHKSVYDLTGLDGLMRMFRNVYLNLAKGYSALAFFLLIAIFLFSTKKSSTYLGWFLIILTVVLQGAIWTGDFMPRRLAFIAPIAAIIFVKRMSFKAIFLVVYLAVIVYANSLLYSRPSQKMPIYAIEKAVNYVPENEVYLQTHYLDPYVRGYKGELVFIDTYKKGDLEKYFTERKRVFMDSQTVKAPYFLYVGNNYHITSIYKTGISPAKEIFKNYSVCFYSLIDSSNLVIYEVKESGTRCDRNFSKKTNNKGETVTFYSDNLLNKINRERVDYGDMAVWLWYLTTSQKDALDWTYTDVEGYYVDTTEVLRN
uniref:Glycosyltransferase RgtA/B/C/D-like domain-containing protein n=1 Tax=uncultured Microgenomates bacterium Rifle_16ft_4_minimus_5036 TaxID=1665119 RepID=A0A0H4TBS8_9BACT|nr:Uncharacterized protein [uncultured Microgenomates bacterium Rifle_16ft_4_minimus_5036]